MQLGPLPYRSVSIPQRRRIPPERHLTHQLSLRASFLRPPLHQYPRRSLLHNLRLLRLLRRSLLPKSHAAEDQSPRLENWPLLQSAMGLVQSANSKHSSLTSNPIFLKRLQ